jgi:hypothetical protein
MLFFASPTHYKNVILRACDFFDLHVFSAYPTSCISTPDKAVILSEALRRSIANRGLYGAESKDLGGAYLAHAAGTFSTTEARTWRARHGLSLGPRTRTASIWLWPAAYGTASWARFSQTCPN